MVCGEKWQVFVKSVNKLGCQLRNLISKTSIACFASSTLATQFQRFVCLCVIESPGIKNVKIGGERGIKRANAENAR